MPKSVNTKRVQKQSDRLESGLGWIGAYWQLVALGLGVLILFLAWLTA